MIYFDNAATGGFKPYCSVNAAVTALRFLCANPGRSGHRLSLSGADIVYRAREALCAFFGGDTPDRVIFTKNCTEALNTAVFGVVRKGDHVITSQMEHNSVLRPLFFLQKEGAIELTVLPVKKFTPVTAEAVRGAIKKNTRLCCLSHAGNVTGDRIDLTAISAALKEKGVLFLVDAAQSAGHTAVNMKKSGIDLLAVAGHKGLYAAPGSGALLFREGVEVRPLTMGGTGSMSFSPDQPEEYPDRLESGTLNLPAVSSLLEGVNYLTRYMGSFSETLFRETKDFISELSKLSEIELYSKPNEFGIVAFAAKEIPSQELADELSERYDIAVRGGYHCAPLMHRALGTEENGLVRVSLSPQNSRAERKTFLAALKEIFSERKAIGRT